MRYGLESYLLAVLSRQRQRFITISQLLPKAQLKSNTVAMYGYLEIVMAKMAIGNRRVISLINLS